MTFPRPLSIIGLCLFSLFVFGCDSKPTISKITVIHPKANPAPMGAPAGAVYFEIVNQGELDDQLILATSPVADSAEVHQTTIDDTGMMRMIPRPNLTIKAGESIKFEPGGYHLMLLGLKKALPQGGETTVELTFKHAGKISLKVPITGLMVHGQMPMDSVHQKALHGMHPAGIPHQGMGKMPMGGGLPKAQGENPHKGFGKIPMGGKLPKAQGENPHQGMGKMPMGGAQTPLPAGHPALTTENSKQGAQ